MSAKAGIHIFSKHSLQRTSCLKTVARRQQNFKVPSGGNKRERIIAWLGKKRATCVCKLCLSVSVWQITEAASVCTLNEIVTNMKTRK
jgi:hypothetical protein